MQDTHSSRFTRYESQHVFDAIIKPAGVLPARKRDEVLVLGDELGFAARKRLVVVHPGRETFVMPWQWLSDGCKYLAAQDQFI